MSTKVLDYNGLPVNPGDTILYIYERGLESARLICLVDDDYTIKNKSLINRKAEPGENYQIFKTEYTYDPKKSFEYEYERSIWLSKKVSDNGLRLLLRKYPGDIIGSELVSVDEHTERNDDIKLTRDEIMSWGYNPEHFEQNSILVGNSYKVIWTNGDVTKEHGTFSTFIDAYESIRNWWDFNRFNPPYVRIIERPDDNRITIDYGYHTLFYHILVS